MFGEKRTSHGLDFSGLETNPNYNPEGGEPTGSEPVQVEPTSTEPVEPQNITNPEGGEPTGSEPVGQEPSGSSLTPEPEPIQVEPEPLEIPDEVLFQKLSEKLGKEVTLESLTQEPTPVENPLDSDPYLKELYEWRNKTGRPLEDWVKFQKNYTEQSDLDVAREFLQYEYPTLNDSEINLELKKFIPSSEDLDDEAAIKNLELKKYATKGRNVLGELVSKLGEPSDSYAMNPEVQQKVQFADTIKEQIAQNNILQENYNKGIQQAVQSLDSYSMKLSDDLSIDFKIPLESKSELPNMINEMPHWKNQDGSWNHKAVAEDGLKIKHFDEMLRLAFEQGLNSGKEALITQTNNTTLGENRSMAGQPSDGSKGVVIEDQAKILGGRRGMSIRFGKK